MSQEENDYQQGISLLHKGLYEQSLEYLKNASKNGNKKARIMLAASLLVIDKQNEAKKTYLGDIVDMVFSGRLADLFFHDDQALNAKRMVQLCNDAIKIDSNLKEIWVEKGIWMEACATIGYYEHNMNQELRSFYYEEAKKCYREALRIDPNYAKALSKLQRKY